MSPEAHPFREEVLAALRCLRNPAGLRNSPLLDHPAVRRELLLTHPLFTPDELAVALCERLKIIIEDLRPSGDENLRQRDWLRYYVLHYLFQRGDSVLSTQRVLSISRSYLYELRSQAIDNVATLLLSTTPSVTILRTEPIPYVTDFVGREEELALYRQWLAVHNLAVIYGFAGTGKTALAAQVAAERQQAGYPVIWVTFYPGINTDLDSFLEILACALDELGDSSLHTFLLAGAREGRRYPVDARIHYAVNSLSSWQVTLCLDDAHLVEEVVELQRFLSSLVPRQQKSRIPLIVASRSEPACAQGRHLAPLPGMSDRDSGQLFRRAGMDWLDDDDLAQLQRRTEGNVAFLKFFIAWAQTPGVEGLSAPERAIRTRTFIGQLGRSPESQRFLLDEVVTGLMVAERAVLEPVALARKPLNLAGGPFAALLPDLDPAAVQLAIVQLHRKNLLMRGGEATVYRVHDLLRNHLLVQLDEAPDHRTELHRRLVGYYTEMNDFLEVAFHHCRAGEQVAAAELLTRHADDLIHRGQAAAMAVIAQEIPATTLPLDLRLAWYDKLGVVHQAIGDNNRAFELYAEALSWPDVPVRRQAEFHQSIAHLHERQGHYAQVRQHCEQGLALLTEEEVGGLAWITLTRQVAWLEMRMGNVAQSVDLSRQVVEAMERNPDLDLPRGAFYASHGAICFQCGDLAAAERYMRRGLALSQASGAVRSAAMTLNNLADVLKEQGQIDEALICLAEAEQLYEKAADSYGLAVCCATRAGIYLEQDQIDIALPLLNRELDLSRQLYNRHLEADALLGLGKAHLQTGNLAQAQVFLRQALALNEEMGNRELQEMARACLAEAESSVTRPAR